MPSERESAAPSSPDGSTSEIPESWRCICGKGDGSGKYILCDNEDCPVGWYHWECVKVVEEPVGTWLCLTCSPNAAFYAKQLAKKPAASSLVSTFKKGATPSSAKPVTKVPRVAAPFSSNEKKIAPESGPSIFDTISAKKRAPISQTESGAVAKKGLAVKWPPVPEMPQRKWRPVPEKATSIPSSEKEIAPGSGPSTFDTISAKKRAPIPRTESGAVTKKGLAVRKPPVPEMPQRKWRLVPEKPKPKWKGWQGMASDEEEEFKKQVDARWKIEDGATGRLTRGSKVAAGETESGSRRLRTRSVPNAQVTKQANTDSSESASSSSSESAYNEEANEEEEGDEEAEGEEAPGSEDSSDRDVHEEISYEQFEDRMDLDDGADHDDKDSLFDGSSDVDEERSEEERDDYQQSSEGHEMDFDQEDSVDPSSNGASIPSDYEDGNGGSSSPTPQPPPKVYYARKRGIPSSPTPELTSRTSSSSPSAGAPDNEIIVVDDSMDHVDYITISSRENTESDGDDVDGHHVDYITISSRETTESDGDDVDGHHVDYITISSRETTESDGDDVDGDGMDIDNDDDEPEVQILEGSQVPASVTSDGEDSDIQNPYRVYPQSADRSTLPRLG